MTSFRVVALLAACGMLVAASSVFGAGQNRAGTAAAAELLLPVGARAMALGGASAATRLLAGFMNTTHSPSSACPSSRTCAA